MIIIYFTNFLLVVLFKRFLKQTLCLVPGLQNIEYEIPGGFHTLEAMRHTNIIMEDRRGCKVLNKYLLNEHKREQKGEPVSWRLQGRVKK